MTNNDYNHGSLQEKKEQKNAYETQTEAKLENYTLKPLFPHHSLRSSNKKK